MNKREEYTNSEPKNLLLRTSGRFYTHERVARKLSETLITHADCWGEGKVDIVEPFSGDGRLVAQLLRVAARLSGGKERQYNVELWDCDAEALSLAERNVAATAQALGLNVIIHARCGNTFLLADAGTGKFDVCITNPPWETLKPDRRELACLSQEAKEEHIGLLREYDQHLADLYPLSRPLRRFSGWGTNLARCGAELSLRLLRPNGICGLVVPVSLLADQISERLRRWMLHEFVLSDIAFYPAELRLFEKVDQPFITLVAYPGDGASHTPQITLFHVDNAETNLDISAEEWRCIVEDGRPVPLRFEGRMTGLDEKLERLPLLQDWDGGRLWTGRELDETGHQQFLAPQGVNLFLKGRMVGRYRVVEEPTQYIRQDGPRIPKTVDQPRIVWRDVSRPTQKRRMQATIIPEGWVTGNSLSVASLQNGDISKLKALLAVMNSFVFEAQIRSKLATGHISVGVVRQARVPLLDSVTEVEYLANLVDMANASDKMAEVRLEVRVAMLYCLSRDDFGALLTRFPKVEPEEVTMLMECPEWQSEQGSACPAKEQGGIPNHYSASLSALDLEMARCIPPGGNWKDIPDSVPSQRIRQIREGFAAGEGSRSTYYGRLDPDRPAYTVNTHFCRPGNGCHLHYDYDGGQHRVLSQREAARLQSFPDSFVFCGSRNAVNQQIGNAVPPLLAYQIARSLPYRGKFLDLFAGAGGLALGFMWAGWEPVIANDITASFLNTYRRNIHDATVCGDIRHQSIFDEIVGACAELSQDGDTPLFVLGGPPCQGYSTAGNRRSMEDDRNWLFRQYRSILDAVHPAGFLFENVTGILNIEKGFVFQMVQDELRSACRALSVWKLNAEEYGIPQCRTRIVLFGDNCSDQESAPPPPITSHVGKRRRSAQASLFDDYPQIFGVRDALSDLPSLRPGEDGSGLNYVAEPSHPYQAFLRGFISSEEYLAHFRR
jgi:Alw26I/Eco31I/Esp3I family type II restriction m6 adenine DNA methyltransferase